jgi:methionyl-tRNA synthetase
METQYKRHLITAALPYANGPVHIGHLAGVYVPADIYVRYLRLRGEDVLFICGSDEHGVPITIKARQEKVSPQAIVDKFHGMIRDAFSEFGISFSIYSRTTSKTHYKTASDFFRKLYDKGDFIEKTTSQYYDEEAQQFLADRYITGTCPVCGNESAYGDQCEKCGSSLNATDLKNPKSMISGSTPVLRDTLHWFLPLDRYEEFLRKWILEDNKDWKQNVIGQCKSWLDAGLQPRAVSRDLDWGIPVPVEGAAGKVLYVWFDAPIGYISATRDLTDDWEKYWKDPETHLVHFIGKDNIVFHCIVFPAMLKAEGSYILPANVPANEFLNLEGEKISTSRNWAVWLHEYLQDFPGKQDVLRYVLCSTMPEAKDNDFTWKDFQARNNNELVAVLGNFVNRALVLTHKYFEGRVPPVAALNDADRAALAELPRLKEAVEYNLDNFRFREALKSMMEMARLGNKYLADNEPWKVIKTDAERVGTVLNISLQITANLAIVAQPFLPFSAIKMAGFINLGTSLWKDAGRGDILEAGHVLGEASLLFEKIEDEAIDLQLLRLQQTKEKNLQVTAVAKPQKEDISYDDFSRMDIRIGTILEAVKVPKTKKLMQLKVDTGMDVRTVVSGIAEYFEPDEIIGKQICLLANLAPREIKGIQSQGMILLAEDASGKLVFVTPEEGMKPGAEVK